MSKNDFDSIEELIRELESDIIDISNKEINSLVKEVYKTQVDYAYSEYQPVRYNRRYDRRGGFADENMWKSSVEAKNGNIEYTMWNESKAVGRDYGEYLDEIIEEGYYQYSPSPNARPVAKRTQEILDSTSHLDMALDDGLSRKGWK